LALLKIFEFKVSQNVFGFFIIRLSLIRFFLKIGNTWFPENIFPLGVL